MIARSARSRRWRVRCLAVLATNFPSRFYWTGGAYLRWDWLFYLVGGICLVRKDRGWLGGAFLGYAALLRLFPLLAFSGPALVIARQLWGVRHPGHSGWTPPPVTSAGELVGRVDQRYRALLGGAVIAFAVLVPLSLVTGNGLDGYRKFFANTQKHAATPLTNDMGLRTVVAWKPSEVERLLRADGLDDPWVRWKQARLRTFHERAPLYWLAAAAFTALLWGALRGAEPWVACCLGTMMIAVGVEVTCYYYAFLFAVGLLYEKREEVGAILLAITAATGLIAWAPTKYLGNVSWWGALRVPPGLDEIYVWMSIATLLGFAWIIYSLTSTMRTTAAP